MYVVIFRAITCELALNQFGCGRIHGMSESVGPPSARLCTKAKGARLTVSIR